MALPLNSRWSAASRALEPERLPTIDNTPQLATAHHVDIDKRIDDLFLELAYIDCLLKDVWLAVCQLWPAPACQCALVNDAFTTALLMGPNHCLPTMNSCQSPSAGITPRHADSPPCNRKLVCKWFPGEHNRVCNQQFESQRDLICHLNHVHGVNGPAKREIRCQWLLNADSSLTCSRVVRRAGFSRHVDVHVEATFMCSYPGCKKSYSRQDVLQKHIIKHHTQSNSLP